jgi:hypothetical protein
MKVVFERFGRSYMFQVPEPGDMLTNVAGIPGKAALEHGLTAVPGMCVLDALDGLNNLIRSVFPEMEGHHLAVICDDPNDGCQNSCEGPGELSGDESVDLGKN